MLAHLLPLQFVVPFILLLDFTASVVMRHKAKQHVNWKEIRPLLPFSLIGIGLGVVVWGLVLRVTGGQRVPATLP